MNNAFARYDEDDGELGPDPDKQAWGVSGPLVTGGSQTQGLLANFKEPGEYTVEFGITLPPAVHINHSPARAEAEITFSAAGFAITRRVTLSNGLTISGTGQSVRVVIMDVPTRLGGNPGLPTVGEQYQVTATVVKGVRPVTPIPPMLVPSGAPSSAPGASGEGGVYNLPANSQVNLDIPAGVGVTGIYVGVYASAALPPGGFSVDMYSKLAYAGGFDPRVFQWVPLVPGVDRIQLFNRVGSPTVIATVYYAIDG